MVLVSFAPATRAAGETSLRTLAEPHGRLIGTAVKSDAVLGEAAYHETLVGQFNLVTPENAMKFGPLSPARGSYNFAEADAIVAFAEEHGMRVRGHTLVWHLQLPDWLTGGQWSREDLIQILHEHVTTVVGHYRGRLYAWDVVNEAVNDDGTLRDTLWLRGIGPEYIELAFRWAREADPDALLFYNDYDGEGLGTKSDAIYALVADLKQRGVPIDGVGLQMHVAVDSWPAADAVAANMQRLAGLGLQAHITEMDVRVPQPPPPDALSHQAEVYGRMLQVCLAAANCTAFSLWGFTDNHSWIPDFFPGWGHALVFDAAYQPKPAFQELVDHLSV
jgi:endo-1,4-beta-xylanase